MLAAALSLMDGGRAVLILFFLSLLFKSILNHSPIKLAIVSIGNLLIIISISMVMLWARYTQQGAQIISNRSIQLSDSVTGLTFIDHIQLSMQYAEQTGFNFGRAYVDALLSFVPRTFYPDKSIPLAAQIRDYFYGDPNGGIPPGLFGEAYIMGGIFGVLIISILYGRLLLATSLLCTNAKKLNCPTRYATAGIMVPLIGFTLVRGGLDIGVLRVGLPFIWILIAGKFAKLGN